MFLLIALKLRSVSIFWDFKFLCIFCDEECITQFQIVDPLLLIFHFLQHFFLLVFEVIEGGYC